MSFKKGQVSLRKGSHHTKETIEKLRIARRNQISPMKGKHHSEVTKHKLRLANIGIKHTEESKEKMRKFALTSSNFGMRGKHHTEETKKIMKEKRAFQKKVINPSTELKLQSFLKQLNIEYYPHQYMKEIEHSYQCDIFIPSLNLIIEADGDYWHNFPFGREIDHIRTKELQEVGFNVLRLWERDIKLMDAITFKEKLDSYSREVLWQT